MSKLFTVGNEQIDNEHRKILEYILQLDDNALPLDKRYNLFSSTIGYIAEHLRDEEHWMYSIGYPDLEAHREEHEKIKTEFLFLIKEVLKFNPEPHAIKNFKLLFLHHIEHWDMKIAEWWKNENKNGKI